MPSIYRIRVSFVSADGGLNTTGYEISYSQGTETAGFSIVGECHDIFSRKPEFQYRSMKSEKGLQDAVEINGVLNSDQSSLKKFASSATIAFDTQCSVPSERICLYFALYDFCQFILEEKTKWFYVKKTNSEEREEKKRLLHGLAFEMKKAINEKINSAADVADRIRKEETAVESKSMSIEENLEMMKCCTLHKKISGRNECLIGRKIYSIDGVNNGPGLKLSAYEVGWAVQSCSSKESLPSFVIVNAPDSALHGGVYSVIRCVFSGGKKYYEFATADGGLHTMSENHLELCSISE